MSDSLTLEKKPSHPWRGRGVYLDTALQFGAQIAAADDEVTVIEFDTLADYFNIGWVKRFTARRTYLKHLSNPRPLRSVLSPFVNVFGKGSAAAETFLIGMCRVAIADESADTTELSKLRLAGSQLGLSSKDVERVLGATGMIDFEEPVCDPEDWVGRGYGPKAEAQRKQAAARGRWLVVLGLEHEPSKREIEKAYRRLAKKYDPAAPGMRHMPRHELERANAMRERIELAYKFLSRSAA